MLFHLRKIRDKSVVLLSNKRTKVALIALAVLGVCFVAFPVAFANYTNIQGVKENFTNFIKGMQLNSVEYMAQAYDAFSEIYAPIGSSSGVLNFSNAMYAIVATLAGAAVSILFTSNIIKESMKGDLTAEYWQRVIISLAISLVATIMSTRIMIAIYDIGKIVVEGFSDLTSVSALSEVNEAQMAKLLANIPGMEKLPDIVGGSAGEINYEQITKADSVLVAMEYVVWFPMVICVFLMYSAIFEIKIRELFAPLAVASIVNEGSRGSGARFLKKYAACFLKIAIYFAIAYLGMSLTQHFYAAAISDSSSSLSIQFIYMLLSNVVAGMAMMQTGGLADEIIGV